MSEKSLLIAFIEADEKGTGLLDVAGLGNALRHIGLTGEKRERFCKLLADKLQDKAKESEGSIRKHGDSRSPVLSFPEWYDIVSKTHVTDGLGSVHNFFIGLVIKLAVRSENQVGLPFPSPLGLSRERARAIRTSLARKKETKDRPQPSTRRTTRVALAETQANRRGALQPGGCPAQA